MILLVAMGSCVLGAAMIFFSFGTFFCIQSISFLLLGAIAILAAARYTLGPKPYGYRGLGDISVLIFFGFATVLGGYYLSTGGHIEPDIILPALAIGCFSVAVLNVNNIRDMATDAATRTTVALKLGPRKARIYQTALIVGGFLLMAVFCLIRKGGLLTWLWLLTAPLFAKHLRGVWKLEDRALDPMLPLLVISSFLFSVLAGIGFNAGHRSLEIPTDDGTLVLTPLAENAVRVRLTPKSVAQLEELIYVGKPAKVKWSSHKDRDAITLETSAMRVEYSKADGWLSFYDADGGLLVSESSRTITPSEVQGEPTLAVSQAFSSPADEHIYGTGQFQDGYLDVKGLTRRLTQVNTQIAIPFIFSSKGYGFLWHNYGLTDFNPADSCLVLEQAVSAAYGQMVNATGTSGNRREMRWNSSFAGVLDIPEDGRYCLMLDVGQAMARRHYLTVDGEPLIDVSNLWLPPTASVIADLPQGVHRIEVDGVRGDSPKVYWRKVTDETVWSSPVSSGLDYTIFAGSADEVISTYRTLTGPVPQMPDWMFGYIHCRERYHSQDEILANAGEFKRRGLPLDVIVQDWQWWGSTGWNSMEFDPVNYPDPKALTDSLHAQDTHFMISVWSKVDRPSALGKRLEEAGCYIDGTDWIDFFDPEATARYVQSFRDSLAVPYGIDAWWFDATEPENDDLAGRRVGSAGTPGEVYRNVYPLMVNKAMYEGLKPVTDGHEPVILTRSAFSGIQRYGVVTWSGDVGNDFKTLRHQIAGGLGQMSTGLPWWTFDAGGFFRPGDQYTSDEYQERMLRWLQVATFLPMMRVHGYMSETEPWRYSDATYEIFAFYLDLRRRLQPYILDSARRVSEEGYTMMRPLVFDFPTDEEALALSCEYMFGPSLLICPVTEAGVSSWRCYLPANATGWADFWTGERYDGGQWVEVPVNLRTIPVFVRDSELSIDNI